MAGVAEHIEDIGAAPREKLHARQHRAHVTRLRPLGAAVVLVSGPTFQETPRGRPKLGAGCIDRGVAGKHANRVFNLVVRRGMWSYRDNPDMRTSSQELLQPGHDEVLAMVLPGRLGAKVHAEDAEAPVRHVGNHPLVQEYEVADEVGR